MGGFFSRAAYLSFAVVVGLVIGLQVWSGSTQPALGNQFQSGGLASNGLITHVLKSDGKAVRIVVIDPQQRSMGVYDISGESGEIELKSVRRLTADLQMTEYNNAGLSPEDIQKAIQR